MQFYQREDSRYIQFGNASLEPSKSESECESSCWTPSVSPEPDVIDMSLVLHAPLAPVIDVFKGNEKADDNLRVRMKGKKKGQQVRKRLSSWLKEHMDVLPQKIYEDLSYGFVAEFTNEEEVDQFMKEAGRPESFMRVCRVSDILHPIQAGTGKKKSEERKAQRREMQRRSRMRKRHAKKREKEKLFESRAKSGLYLRLQKFHKKGIQATSENVKEWLSQFNTARPAEMIAERTGCILLRFESKQDVTVFLKEKLESPHGSTFSVMHEYEWFKHIQMTCKSGMTGKNKDESHSELDDRKRKDAENTNQKEKSDTYSE